MGCSYIFRGKNDMEKLLLDWPGIKSADELVFRYDPLHHTLAVHHSRTNKIYTITVNPDKQYRAMVYGYGASFQVGAVSILRQKQLFI
mmetsp:Transcript_9904/g.10004  ORF Transcript_9904/g.10004 Transcript_9904/m.10004 type:complete len:88 (+) Transcript_9904:520-783(+)